MKNSIIKKWQSSLQDVARKEKIEILSSFFKTGVGEYGEGDIFIGVTVPDNRAVAQKFYDAPIEVILEMLDSPIHEYRLSALLAMVHAYKKAKGTPQKDYIVKTYIDNCHKCNNWDLVDLSAPYLLGAEIADGRHLEELDTLSASPTLWHRRIAVVATLTPVRLNMLDVATDQCLKHICDQEPLMQKAVGWVLREVGKKSETYLTDFLENNISQISATTLSYATERLDKPIRKYWQERRRTAKR